MRLSFANGERADFVMEGGVVNLGSAAGNGIVLADRDVAPWHARMVVDARGIVLEIMDPNARTHVNARPVREKALLRYGDIVCLGHSAIALKVDSDASIVTAIPTDGTTLPTAAQPPRAILRGVSGTHFGKAIAINPRLVVGRSAAADVVIEDRVGPTHAAVEWLGEALWLRDLGTDEGTLLNGVRVRDARLHGGDQLGFGRHQFVVEAPGLAARSEDPVGQDAPVVDAHPAEAEGAGSAGGIGWLLAAAALIALALVFLLHRGV